MKGGKGMMRHAVGVDLGLVFGQTLERNGSIGILGESIIHIEAQNFWMQRTERRLRRIILIGRVERVEGVAASPGAVREWVIGIVTSHMVGWNHHRFIEVERCECSRSCLFREQ